MNKRYAFWQWMKNLADSGMRENYLKPYGGCDSACPKCKTWEYQGNKIKTTPLDDGTDERVCAICGYKWFAIFTPAGFIEINKQGEE